MTYTHNKTCTKYAYKWVADNLDYILGPKHDGQGAKRIEINSVIAKVDDNERLWGYIKKKLLEFAPTRDYNRVMSSSPDLSHRYPKPIRNFTNYIEKHVKSIVAEEKKKIESELENVAGFINVKDKKAEIDRRLGEIVANDEHLQEIAASLDDLSKKEGFNDE